MITLTSLQYSSISTTPGVLVGVWTELIQCSDGSAEQKDTVKEKPQSDPLKSEQADVMVYTLCKKWS